MFLTEGDELEINNMAIIDPMGLFTGDRLRLCSNLAQLHWPRLFLASDGFARLEINYAKIVGQAYATFDPVPSQDDLEFYINEYAEHFLLFLYEVNGQVWGQWDTRPALLPTYKTARDRRSPVPPEPQFSAWKKRYRVESKPVSKILQKVTKTFSHGVGVGVGDGDGKDICASCENDDARISDLPLLQSGAVMDTGFVPAHKVSEWTNGCGGPPEGDDSDRYLDEYEVAFRDRFGRWPESEECPNRAVILDAPEGLYDWRDLKILGYGPWSPGAMVFRPPTARERHGEIVPN
jgi:hypothetical protein